MRWRPRSRRTLGLCQSTFLCPFRDEGLNSSQTHIALNDHASLFQETKEQLDGSVNPAALVETPHL